MYWLCSEQNCLLCAYEHDFNDNYIIPIVKAGLTTKKYAIVLSVLNLVSDFVKCNHTIRVIFDSSGATAAQAATVEHESDRP
jgi:hypothetical protein